LLDRISHTIVRFAMFQPGQRVGVAVSGGADSVCLLHVLVELAPRWDLRLSVLHLDHRLRGAESRQDAAFVRELAGRLELPFTLREADIAGAPENLEEAARNARLAFFREVLASGDAERIALGHTASDQAETVLFRFLRGAGTAGLAGIRPVTGEGIVRPLIDVTRAEVVEYLRRREIPWREDSSNSSRQFARNRIRLDLLPQLEREWNPRIRETLANTADWALEEEAYWEAETGRLAAGRLIERGGAVLMRVDALRDLSLAAARRLVRRAMELAKGDLRSLDFRHIGAVIEMASGREGHGRLQVPGLDIFRSFEWLRFGRPGEGGLETRNYQLPAPVPGVVRALAAGLDLSLELVENQGTTGVSDYVYNDEMAGLDWHRVSGPLEVRNWRPGDQYRPFGSAGDQKIKSLFQEARIPLWERRHWPVLTDRWSEIVWSRRFGPAAGLAAGAGSRVILRIRDAEVR
jgi:tRNA(Ile)-lysidine synthase